MPSVAHAPLRVARCRSIHEVGEAHWDSINGPSDYSHSHRFIRSVEDARVEDSEFWYLLFYREDVLVATAVLSAFRVALDLFVGGAAARFIDLVRRRRPGFMRIRVLFCGLPISLGQSNLVVGDGVDAADALSLLVREMTAICRAQRIRHMCVKEFPATRLSSVRAIERHGFFRAHTLPYVTMSLPWTSFDAYLASLRHGYRRPIRLSLKRLGCASPVIATLRRAAPGAFPAPLGDASGGPAHAAQDPAATDRVGAPREPAAVRTAPVDLPRLVLGGPEVCPPERLYELYLNVMARARVKLETLNQAFFERLYANLGSELELLALVKNGETLSCALLTSADRTMTFMLVGLDYARRDEHDVYFNLLYGIIALAIERGCTQLHLGQTSYWLKQRVGGRCIPQYMYFRSNLRVIHVGLRLLRSCVFPPTRVTEPRVFRHEAELMREPS